MPSHQRSQAPAAAPLPTASKPRTFTSERNIVFHVVELARRLLGGGLGLAGFALGGLALGGLGLGALPRRLARLAWLAGTGARPPHLPDVPADLRRATGLPPPVPPPPRAP